MQITLSSDPDKQVVAHLLQLYLHDFSIIDGMDVDETGCYPYPFLDCYWQEPGRYPFVIRVDDDLAGFVLVHRLSYLHPVFDGHAIAEFFVLRKYRRMGVGCAAALLVFDRLPGVWEVASAALNIPAHAFWRSTITKYTHGRYREVWLQDERWHGPIQSFTSPAVGAPDSQ